MLESEDMWFCRRMLRISWNERITNEKVLRSVQSGRTILKEIVRLQTTQPTSDGAVSAVTKCCANCV